MGDSSSKSELWPADNPAVTAHVTMLQAIIARLATASASSKTWCLALVGALLSFAAGTDSPRLAAFAIVPIIVFAYLDASYLAQERAYRDLFNEVVAKIRDGRYSRSDSFVAAAPMKRWSVLAALTSWSIWPVYLSLLIAYGVAMCSGWIAAPDAANASESAAALAGPAR